MNEHIDMGMRDEWGTNTRFGLSLEDKRHHLYVVGKSGTGKTRLLTNMVVQEIEAGHGVGVIDPHGDMALEILSRIPPWRIEDVVYFDPSDVEYPIGLNLLGHVPQAKRHLVASGIVSVFRSIWPDFWGPRLEYILYATVAALLDCENVSLMGIPRMLSDEAYRSWVIGQIKDPMVYSFWTNEFARYDKRFLQEAVAPIQNKVGQLLMTPVIRNIVGQVVNRVDARFIMDRGRIFIANLSKGKIGADKANLLGALWVTQFELAAMSRADVGEDERKDFGLYVDEFQSFVSDSFASILSEARKYRLSITLSHQYLGQLKEAVLDAVMGNVGSMVVFRVGQKDAEVLERTLGNTYMASQLTSLSNREVCVKLLNSGQDRDPFMGWTLPPLGEIYGRVEDIINRSREKFSATKAVIEDKLWRWLKLPPRMG